LKNIGSVIKEFRTNNNLSQEKLADGICTTKYLYMIEKGRRTPSNAILAKLGEKLNVNFFDYYDYLECEDPIAVKSMADQFALCRRVLDFKTLVKYCNIGSQLLDFNMNPWRLEISFNLALAKLIQAKDVDGARVDIQQTISEMPAEYQYSIFHLRHLSLLALCYLEDKKYKSAEFIIEKVLAEIDGKLDRNGYEQLYFMCTYICIAIKLKSGKYASAIKLSGKINQQQHLKNFYGLIHYNHLLWGYGLLKLGLTDKAVVHIQKGFMTVLVLEKRNDLIYLDRLGILPEILGCDLLEKNILEAITRLLA
jgi:transcriptional regulator with XRE-family HTH domain